MVFSGLGLIQSLQPPIADGHCDGGAMRSIAASSLKPHRKKSPGQIAGALMYFRVEVLMYLQITTFLRLAIRIPRRASPSNANELGSGT